MCRLVREGYANFDIPGSHSSATTIYTWELKQPSDYYSVLKCSIDSFNEKCVYL